MKREWIAAALVGTILAMASVTLAHRLAITDLQHDIKRLEAKIDSHERILVPSAEMRGEPGSAPPYQNGKPVK